VKKTGKNNLAQENERLRKENVRLFAENERLRQEVKLLNEKMDWLMNKMFGSSSEALNSNQLDLFAVLSETQAPEPDASLLAEAMIPVKPKTKSPRRERIPENLPAEEVLIDPPEVLADPEKWRRIGEEISERLDFEPGRFFRRLLVRPKYVLIEDKEAAPVIAPLPECLQERGIAAPGLLATVAVSLTTAHDLTKSVEFMRANVARSLTLQELSRHIGLSPTRYSALFREQTGSSPVDHHIRLRMQAACHYLDTTALSVKEVAAKLGYDDTYYFSRIFQKILGSSPLAYRRSVKG
jgi:AraC-like DNA-binding protein